MPGGMFGLHSISKPDHRGAVELTSRPAVTSVWQPAHGKPQPVARDGLRWCPRRVRSAAPTTLALFGYATVALCFLACFVVIPYVLVISVRQSLQGT